VSDAEIIQGRLGWEAGDVSEADPDELTPHPKNREIYGDTADADQLDEAFRESIAENGVLEPLTITDGKKIISGHRRWLAAKDADLSTVPVRYAEFDSDLAEREALIEFNRQREKTPAQLVREAEELLDIQRQQGKETQGERTDLSYDSTKSDDSGGHDSWKNVAEKVGVSDYTLKQGKKVKDKAESDDEPEAVREAAQEAWGGLESGDESFHGAYTAVKEAEREVEKEKGRERVSGALDESGTAKDDEHGEFGVTRGQWWCLPRKGGDPHLLYCGDTSNDEFVDRVRRFDVGFAFADPPYNADAADWDSGFVWEHDYLAEVADIAAVTPGIESIKSFMRRTGMPYEWSVTAWIDNGMTRGALGFGNWIYVALFADAESLHRQSQDIVRVSVRTSESGETDHKGRKPTELMEWLIDRFGDGGVVLDPFLGSGTTLLAAHEFGDARVIGGELRPEFCDEILCRYRDLTGADPEVQR
jgi:ParB/RepB/Spo0J family partition protein